MKKICEVIYKFIIRFISSYRKAQNEFKKSRTVIKSEYEEEMVKLESDYKNKCDKNKCDKNKCDKNKCDELEKKYNEKYEEAKNKNVQECEEIYINEKMDFLHFLNYEKFAFRKWKKRIKLILFFA